MSILKYALLIAILGVLAFITINRKPEPTTPVPEDTEIIDQKPIAENPDGEADPARMKLDMTEWHWISTEYNDGTKIIPKDSKKFGLTFKNDGTFSASTDCNGIGGNYKVEGSAITLYDMMGTLMYCEGSQEGDFRKSLEGVSSYFFTGRGELIFDLKFDSGTVIFR